MSHPYFLGAWNDWHSLQRLSQTCHSVTLVFLFAQSMYRQGLFALKEDIAGKADTGK
jgi:hypothetical protein